MVTERGSKQARSRERREALLVAAVELITEGGIKAVTHRAVSTRANLPPAAAGYYFTTSNALVEEALRFHVARRAEAVSALLRTASAGATGAMEIGERVTRALVSGESGVTGAQYEVYLEAARNLALRDAVADAMAAFEAAAVPLLAALGIAEPAKAAKAFVAVADGFALHRLANPLPAEEEIDLLLHTMTGLFLTFTASPREIEQQIRARVTPGRAPHGSDAPPSPAPPRAPAQDP